MRIILVLIFASTIAHAQSITSWTEQNGTLGLGYPVPIPVDTAEPFDGFRTYNGLFLKHQSLALNSPMITGHIVGKTQYNRDIWAYKLSDENNLTKYGVKEGAMLINGGIHAREWQSPEVLTGIMELLNDNSKDEFIHQYLLENTTIVALPVNNVDGFLQTQRYPTKNWYSFGGPRDGRMRRKNMLNVDEDLFTKADHLFGVDLNRNNNPYWATSTRSSPDPTSIVHHGPFAQSEPETQARLNAANLVDADQLRVYTDVHSFTKVHFSVRTNNRNRTQLQNDMLLDFTLHHLKFPRLQNYRNSPSGPGGGIGSTDEYFAETYEVPSWTLEIEPGGNGAVEYGGFGNDGHDGFILPESEIKRVREELAQTFMVAWYEQSGPPSVTQISIIDKFTNVVHYQASWDIQSDGSRVLNDNVIENLKAGRTYNIIVNFDKPMRMRDDNGDIKHLQGQLSSGSSGFSLDPVINIKMGVNISMPISNGQWLNEKNDSLMSFKYYKDDSYSAEFSISNGLELDNSSTISVKIDVADMVGLKLDANPTTVVTWADGQWQNYEDTDGNSSIVGGIDANYFVPVREDLIHQQPPRIDVTGLYFDPQRSGEGFSYELLNSGKAWLQWFTYDADGNQKWYSGLGEFDGNVIKVNLTETVGEGGIFGDAFNSDLIERKQFGTLEIFFNGGEDEVPPAQEYLGDHLIKRTATVLFTDVEGKKLRTNLQKLTLVKGVASYDISLTPATPIPPPFLAPFTKMSGSWFNPNRSGEGYIIEVLEDNSAVMLFYTYDLEGNHMWMLGSSGVVTENDGNIRLDFTSTKITNGGVFGEDFNPDNVNRVDWGEFHFTLDCITQKGTVEYQSSVEGFGSGQFEIQKLTQPLLVHPSFVCAL